MISTVRCTAAAQEVGESRRFARCARWCDVAIEIHFVDFPSRIAGFDLQECRIRSPQENLGPTNSGRRTSSSATSRK